MIAATAAPIVLEGRYRSLVAALVRLHRSRRGRWMLALGSGAVVTVLAVLVARHFATTSWPLSRGDPGLLVAAGLLLLCAHALKAYGWGRLFASDERPKALARCIGCRRSLRFRLGRWLSARTTSHRRALQAWALVSTCWLVRAGALFLLLGALGIGYSVPLALLFLCAGAAAAALPIGPAGAATQIGGGAAALLASGVGASQALGVAVSVSALGVLSGTAILVFAVASRSAVSLLPTRATGNGAW